MKATDITPKQELKVINKCYGFEAGEKVKPSGSSVTLGKSGNTVLIGKGEGAALFVDLDNLTAA